MTTDPFDSLGHDLGPVTPRAAFVEQLRRRIEHELHPGPQQGPHPGPQQEGNTMTETDSATADETGYLFYFTLPAADVERAASFYRELFGWELAKGDSGYHVEGVYPPMGLASNDSPAPQVWIEVADINVAVAKVRELGGSADEPVQYASGWSAGCTDDQGVAFNLQVPIPEYRQGQNRSTKPGELFYWTLPALDVDRSRAFYRELFGWEYGEPGDGGGIHVENKLPDGGLGGGRDGSHPDVFFRVADLDDAMATVDRLGGTATFAGEGPEGRHAMCTDDQGTSFGLSQPADGY